VPLLLDEVGRRGQRHIKVPFSNKSDTNKRRRGKKAEKKEGGDLAQ